MTTTTEQAPPTLIPLHNDEGSLPEWAMIELNGELISPSPTAQKFDKENPAPLAEESSLLKNDQVELGSVRFVNNVSCGVAPLQGSSLSFSVSNVLYSRNQS